MEPAQINTDEAGSQLSQVVTLKSEVIKASLEKYEFVEGLYFSETLHRAAKDRITLARTPLLNCCTKKKQELFAEITASAILSDDEKHCQQIVDYIQTRCNVCCAAHFDAKTRVLTLAGNKTDARNVERKIPAFEWATMPKLIGKAHKFLDARRVTELVGSAPKEWHEQLNRCHDSCLERKYLWTTMLQAMVTELSADGYLDKVQDEEQRAAKFRAQKNESTELVTDNAIKVLLKMAHLHKLVQNQQEIGRDVFGNVIETYWKRICLNPSVDMLESIFRPGRAPTDNQYEEYKTLIERVEEFLFWDLAFSGYRKTEHDGTDQLEDSRSWFVVSKKHTNLPAEWFREYWQPLAYVCWHSALCAIKKENDKFSSPESLNGVWNFVSSCKKIAIVEEDEQSVKETRRDLHCEVKLWIYLMNSNHESMNGDAFFAISKPLCASCATFFFGACPPKHRPKLLAACADYFDTSRLLLHEVVRDHRYSDNENSRCDNDCKQGHPASCFLLQEDSANLPHVQ